MATDLMDDALKWNRDDTRDLIRAMLVGTALGGIIAALINFFKLFD